MAVNFFTEINGFSYGVFGKNLALEVNKQLEVCLVPSYHQLFCIEKNEAPTLRKMVDRFNNISFADIGVMFGNGNQMHRFCGRRKIGVTLFFSDILEKSWINQLKQLDAVCVISNWNAAILKKYNINATVIQPGVNIEIFKPTNNAVFDKNQNNAKFKFFSIGKWDSRKNQKLTVEAFCEEFSADENVELYGMWHNPFMKTPIISELIACITNKHKIYTKENPANSTIFLVNPVQSFSQLAAIYNNMHCAVFPYKAEATGLRLFECLASGLPCIATNYSVPAEYLNDNFMYLLRKIQKKALKEDKNYSNVEGNWVEPDKDELKKNMRAVYNDYAAAREKSKFAASEMRKLSWWQSSNKLLNCILNLSNK